MIKFYEQTLKLTMRFVWRRKYSWRLGDLSMLINSRLSIMPKFKDRFRDLIYGKLNGEKS